MLLLPPLQDKDQSSAETIRNLNRAQVLESIRNNPLISYSELVDRIPLSRATVVSIVNELLELGLLQKVGRAVSTGGRPPAMLEYHPEAKLAVGVTMFDNEIKAVLTDIEGSPQKVIERVWEGQRLTDLVYRMTEAVQDVTDSVDQRRLVGVGVGLPGVIDANRGVILEYVTVRRLMDNPIDARQMMEDALHLPVIAANRSRSAALGEIQTGVAQRIKDLIYLSIGRGIVAGIVLGGDLFFGTSFTAGEIGHNTVIAGGPLCGCGNYGCLEMYASESAIVARAISEARSSPNSLLRQMVNSNLQLISIDLIIECARQGDQAALNIINETGSYIGIALSSALNILNPQMIVLGGPIGCKAGNLLVEPTVREIERHALPTSLSCVKIVAGSENTVSAAIGSAVLMLKNTPVDRIFSKK
jgi:N-acetylglucosamine repressor